MSSFKKLVARMAADQVPKTETEESAEPDKSKKGNLPQASTRQQGRIQQAPRPKSQRKQSQKGG